MLKLVLHLNKFQIITIISLLFSTLLLSFSSMNYSMEVYKKADEKHFVNQDVYSRSRTSEKISYARDKVMDSYIEDLDSQEVSTDNYQNPLDKKWISFFIALMASVIFYIKGWLIKVNHWRYLFIMVHFTQLKDGKKDALSYAFSM